MTLRHLTIALFLVGTAAIGVQGYSLSSHKWPTSQVRYYVNPQNLRLSAASVTSAIQTAADVWNSQSLANIELLYAGTTTGSALTLNYKNEVFLRNTSNGSMFARTYTYWDASGRRIDSDIMFYEGAIRFFTISGCATGVYLEAGAAHEFGHMLGLAHSYVAGATMNGTMPKYCDRTWLTLSPDDVAGIEKLY